MKVFVGNIFRRVILILAVIVIVIGIGDYTIKNGEKLLQVSMGIEEDVSRSEIKSNFELTPTPSPTATPEPDVRETGMEWENPPVDFLEEILPEITPDPERGSGNVQEISVGGGALIDNFYVNDTSDSGVDLAQEINKDLGFQVKDLSTPTVLIYHTHSCESYMTGFTGYYYTDSSFRSTNPEKNIMTVGEKMKESLEAKGIGVIHDITIHDSPEFNGCYGRSMETVQSYLKKYPSIKVTIDLHRDSMSTDDGLSYKPTAEIDGRKAAQVMIIAGSDPTGELEFTNWRDNLTFALKIQKKAADLYQGLMRPLMYCQRKYNMDATSASLIFEVGTEVNTFSEARYSGTLMGNVLADVLIDNKE